jgi:type IX secretion system PorP/SprF family membrane protein
MNRILTVTLFLLCALVYVSRAQDLDIHWTQHYNAPFTINPGLTGVFSGDYRFMGNYRNQWYNVPVRYETIALAYDQKILRPGMRNGLFGVGGHFFYDQAGDSQLRILQLALSGSYQHRVGKDLFLSIGAQAGLNNRRYDPGRMTFDSQWNGEFVDPTAPSGEEFLNTNFSFFTVGSGLNLHYQGSRRTWFDVGGGWFNINTPLQRFNEGLSIKTKGRYTGQVNASFELAGPVDLLVRGLAMFQGPNYESLAGAGIRWHLNDKVTRELALIFGVDYRFNQNDAWGPVIGMDYRQWRAMFSYDINVSPFREATNMNGGPEFTLQYIITTVKPLPIIKSCPVY